MTHSDDHVEEYLRQFAEESSLDWAQDEDNPRTIVGQCEIGETEATLRLQVPLFFPSQLPKIHLEPWDAFGFIPHVQTDGLVCYQETEGMVVDRRSPMPALGEEEIPQVQAMMRDEEISTSDICERFDISRATLYRYVGPDGERQR